MKPTSRIAIRGAGVVVAAGLLATFAPAGTAHASHGSLDPTFDGDGRLTTFIHARNGADVAALPDGRILPRRAVCPISS